jgi:hypothetical protein
MTNNLKKLLSFLLLSIFAVVGCWLVPERVYFQNEPKIEQTVDFKQHNVYFFATHLDLDSENAAAARLEVTRLCLQDLKLL